MIEYALAIVLIGVMPARALYKSLWGAGANKVSRSRRYLVSGAITAGLLLVLGYCWLHAARAPALLGLDVPVSGRGMLGLGIAVLLFVVLAVLDVVAKRKGRRSNDEEARRKLAGNDLLPRNRRELALFLGLLLLIGCGWELLYRGFLMWFLVPHVGIVAAVCIAAFAYGAAHGYKSRGQFLGSVVSAFAFTIAFVLTASLWWLMLIHTVVGMAGGFGSYRLLSRDREDLLPDAAEASSP